MMYSIEPYSFYRFVEKIPVTTLVSRKTYGVIVYKSYVTYLA